MYVSIISLVAVLFLFFIKNKRIKAHGKVMNFEQNRKVNLGIDNLNDNIISFRNDLPFHPSSNQIIYLENKTNPQINSFLEQNIAQIEELARLSGYTFFYLGIISDKIKNTSLINYHFPDFNFEKHKILDVELNYDNLLSHLSSDSTEKVKNGLIKYEYFENSKYHFSYSELNDADLLMQFNCYFKKHNVNRIVFQRITDNGCGNDADCLFDKESRKIINEIKERIEKLRIIGIEELFLRSLVDHKPKLSNMVITRDFKIMLPDYGKEIILHPLPKAVYFLFLNHPNGILFKNLIDYREELLSIYKMITARNDTNEMLASISDITNPTKNAINEKCSRIREAFIKEFDTSIAKYYFITGDRGQPKRILLNQENVNISFEK